MATCLRSPIDLPDPDRLSLVSALALSLCDGICLFNGCKLAHWNVSGPSFGPLHALFGEVADLVDASNDTVAELIATCGALVGANLERVVAKARISEYPVKPLGQLDHVREVSVRVDAYLVGVRAACEVAEKVRAIGVAQALGDIVKDVEKMGWQVKKHLELETGPVVEPVTVP